MKTWQKITLASLVAAVVVYAIVICFHVRPRQTHVKCDKVVIEVADSTLRQYVTAPEIANFLTRNEVNPIGLAYDNIDCYRIESFLLRHQMIEAAECYKTPDATVYIEVYQRQPFFRVMGEKSYFIDTNRKVMPITSATATYVPVVTGRVSEKMAQNELYDFIEWLQDDDLWEAQIEQINITPKREVELVPRVGSGIILLGRLDDNYPKRMDKLKKLYTDGFQKTGWKNYKEIDLRFDGQVVCR